ncbi:hypothetical protein SEUCBS140593_006044 [Sporothrix eucalyptigena]|uniref:Transcription factor domain-containing protein n=1 Tax=Sporothrix eucalyptigena TaxID=1812306 RepID=A0ABP0C1J3_9PEZI
MPDNRHTNVLKRLWWSCLIRDRLLSLGVRRTLQIPRAQFDVDRHPLLNTADLADEIAYSRVYNLETKKYLVAVVVHIAELCVVLTDVLAMAYPADWPVWDRQKLERDMGQVQLGNHYLHDSIVLYTHLMHIYYHSGRIALCHYETLNMILYSSIQGPTIANLNISLGNLSVGPGQDASAIQKNLNDLQDAASEVAESLKELVRRRLARWLPISAVPMTALPLFLQTVDVKLSSMSIGTSSHSDISTSTLKQRRLNDLVEAMRTYQPQYEGVDWVSESICHAVKLAQLSAVQVSHPKSRGARNWTDILVSNPSCYLRLAFSVDIALRTNRLPEEDDFPIGIRGVLPGGSGPIRNLFCLIESPAVIPGAPGDMPVKDKRRATDVETIFPGSMTTVSLTPPSLSVDMGLNIADEYPPCYDVDMSISGLFDELGMLDVNLDVCPDGSITNVQDSRVLVDDTEEDGVSF